MPASKAATDSTFLTYSYAIKILKSLLKAKKCRGYSLTGLYGSYTIALCSIITPVISDQMYMQLWVNKLHCL